MISWLTTCIISFSALLVLTNAADPCRFQDSIKGIIDLTSLASSDGKAAYPDKKPPTAGNWKYSYNPCKPFSEGATCKDVAACQVSDDGQYTFILGKHDTAIWNSGAGLGSSPSVSYSDGARKASVSLQCGNAGDNEFEALGEDPPSSGSFKFRLTHKCACWNGCGSGPTPDTTTKSGGTTPGTGIGGGAVFIIILLVLIFVYFVGFALFYRFRMEKSGADLIAHRTFWASLPGYAKDGAVHVYRRVANKGDTPYQSV